MPFEIVRDDITKMKTDAIVNAANRSLLGGGGVDGAIHRAAGPELLEECRTLGGCETGEAKITRGYRLPARYVIHTVGPVWHGGGNGEAELLASCYRNSLRLAAENACESIAFPMISAGAYGYPKDQAMRIAVNTIRAFLRDHDMTVYLVVFGQESFLTGKALYREVREYIDEIYAESRIRRGMENARKALWQRDEKAALDLDMELADRSNAFSAPDHGFACPSAAPSGSAAPDWDTLFSRKDAGFSETLLAMISEKQMTDAECYKKANVDRKLFSKIRNNASYKPTKPTVFAFAMALELSLADTKKLLRRAGFALSHSSKFDIAMEYFIRNRLYDVMEANEALFELDLPLLGSGAGG